MIKTAQPLTAYEAATLEDRCVVRSRVDMQASLRPSCGSKFPVRIYDLSIAGFSCDAVASIPTGGRCWITFPGLASMEAEVVWNDGHRLGCALCQFLNVAVFDRLVAQYPYRGT